jgi:hypothetical protein
LLGKKDRLIRFGGNNENNKSKRKVSKDNLEGKSQQELFNDAVELYQRAVSGNGKCARQAVDLFKHLSDQVPGNSLIMAYYGASNVLMGRYEKIPMRKGTWINNGLDIIDKAVSKDPYNTKIRILRAYACFHLPAFFNRISTTINDFEYLLAQNEREPGCISEHIARKIKSDLEVARKKFRP